MQIVSYQAFDHQKAADMGSRTIESWAAAYRVAAAAREIDAALRCVIAKGGELDAAVADAKRIGISEQEIVHAAYAETQEVRDDPK